MFFWIVTGAITLAASSLLAMVILRGRSAGEPAAAYDLRLYRQQLKDVDRDLARGVIQENDAARIRTEVSRRILAADAALKKHQSGDAQPKTLSLAVGGGAALAMLVGAFALYWTLGAPGYDDQGLHMRLARSVEAARNRPSQALMEQDTRPFERPNSSEDYKNLIAELRAAVAQRPDDARGQALLAHHEAELGNFSEAHQAKANYIRLKSGAVRAADYAELAELMVLAAGGLVSPEAEDALKQALERDPNNGTARYFWGLMMAQLGRPDVTFGVWRETLIAGPAGAPWVESIRAQIEDIAYLAGQQIDPDLLAPPSQTGPTAQQLRDGQSLPADEQQEMIRGMIEGLAERLSTEGGSAADWARLITSLTVLGDVERAQSIYDEAQKRFAGAPEQAALIEAAARQAGLSPE
ncbi:c-type cytochrome biogenesis protein CcmI [Epibacterium sp. SM1969]|uniref:C-type cytochrome biogenesis protein CcmI n=1 Tax=Tritonibacter aquimaris TaxID=2663379 RepID=A0A844B157_9RHOB|nr:c-type cytochrome biogenesis protein CcmI [Tritonibacter aquimaris]MQY44274.1 c-type cytochrome biogenesis protein CcmI [Tritonibacter aquimaris]